jgi:hypothetical protein
MCSKEYINGEKFIVTKAFQIKDGKNVISLPKGYAIWLSFGWGDGDDPECVKVTIVEDGNLIPRDMKFKFSWDFQAEHFESYSEHITQKNKPKNNNANKVSKKDLVATVSNAKEEVTINESALIQNHVSHPAKEEYAIRISPRKKNDADDDVRDKILALAITTKKDENVTVFEFDIPKPLFEYTFDFFDVYDYDTEDWVPLRDSFLCYDNDLITKIVFKEDFNAALVQYMQDWPEGFTTSLFIVKNCTLKDWSNGAERCESFNSDGPKKCWEKGLACFNNSLIKVSETKKKLAEEQKQMQEKRNAAKEGGWFDFLFGQPKCHNCGKRTRSCNRVSCEYRGQRWKENYSEYNINRYGRYRAVNTYWEEYECEFCEAVTGAWSETDA